MYGSYRTGKVEATFMVPLYTRGYKQGYIFDSQLHSLMATV